MFQAILNQVHMLQQSLLSSDYQLPIFVRFRTQEKYITVGVVALDLGAESIMISTSENSEITVGLAELIEVVAFRDASGKPVFLTECFDAVTVVDDLHEEDELCQSRMDAFWLKYRDVYTKNDPNIPLFKSPVRTEKRTAKVSRANGTTGRKSDSYLSAA
ncbi:MAG: hypothetical protein NTV54_08560 [Ignavibacteriales bacterium]|nr:hypothetical protein [Ignavibacteriales bacterium]